jgi:predicted nucleic acid-binding protein
MRPSLRDPNDEFPLELAVAGGVNCIATHSVRHLADAGYFGIQVMTPGEFLRKIEEGRK